MSTVKQGISREPIPASDGASRWERILSYLFVREDIPTRRDKKVLYLRRFHIFSEKLFPKALWGKDSKWPRIKFLLSLLPSIYVHCFYRSDEDPDPHDHPFDFLTLVGAGGYADETWWVHGGPKAYNGGAPYVVERIERRPGSLAFRWATHIHRAILLDPSVRTWTFVFRGPRRRDWGFWTENGWVHWVPYLRQRLGQAYVDAKGGQ